MWSSLVASIPSPTWGRELKLYGIMIAIGVIAAIEVARRRWMGRGGDPDDIYSIAFWAVPAGLIGARLYHVVTDNQLYRDPDKFLGLDFVAMLKIWQGGLGIPGGIALGVGVGVWVAYKRGMRLPVGLDVVAPGIALAQAIGRWGNYFNQELYGRPSDLPWAVQIDAAHRPAGYFDVATYHPTFLYESLWNLALCGVLILIDRKRVVRPGNIFAIYLGGYFLGRLWVEALRIDEANKILGLRVNTWMSLIVMVAVAIFLLIRGLRRRPGDSDEPYRDGHRWMPEAHVVEPADEEGDAAMAATGAGTIARAQRRAARTGSTDPPPTARGGGAAEAGADAAPDDAVATEPPGGSGSGPPGDEPSPG